MRESMRNHTVGQLADAHAHCVTIGLTIPHPKLSIIFEENIAYHRIERKYLQV